MVIIQFWHLLFVQYFCFCRVARQWHPLEKRPIEVKHKILDCIYTKKLPNLAFTYSHCHPNKCILNNAPLSNFCTSSNRIFFLCGYWHCFVINLLCLNWVLGFGWWQHHCGEIQQGWINVFNSGFTGVSLRPPSNWSQRLFRLFFRGRNLRTGALKLSPLPGGGREIFLISKMDILQTSIYEKLCS